MKLSALSFQQRPYKVSHRPKQQRPQQQQPPRLNKHPSEYYFQHLKEKFPASLVNDENFPAICSTIAGMALLLGGTLTFRTLAKKEDEQPYVSPFSQQLFDDTALPNTAPPRPQPPIIPETSILAPPTTLTTPTIQTVSPSIPLNVLDRQTYENKRNRMIAEFEHSSLLQSGKGLKPEYDGGVSIAVGYGLDLLIHDNDKLNQYLSAAGLSLSQNDADLLTQYREKALQDSGVRNMLINNLDLNLKSPENAMKILGAMMNDVYEPKFDALLGVNYPPTIERAVGISLIFNKGTKIFHPEIINAYQQGDRLQIWYELRHFCWDVNNRREEGLPPLPESTIHALQNRRYREAKIILDDILKSPGAQDELDYFLAQAEPRSPGKSRKDFKTDFERRF